jgi:hypothetical protein
VRSVVVKPKFFGSTGALLSENRSQFANRHSPFAAVLARQEPRPPNQFRRLKSALIKLVIKCGLKHVAWIVLVASSTYGLKPVAWFGFG